MASADVEFGRLDRALKVLPQKVQKKVVRQAVTAGQKIVMAEAKQNARTMIGGRMGGIIADHMKLRTKTKKFQYTKILSLKGNEQEFVHITKDNRRHYIPADIEYGHGASKDTAAIPYMRKAADTKEREATDKAIKLIGDGIEREAKALLNI